MTLEEAHKWLEDHGWECLGDCWGHPDREWVRVYRSLDRWQAIHQHVDEYGNVNTTRFGPIPAHASGESPEAALKALEVVAAEMIVKVRKLYDQLLGIILN